MGVMDKFLNYMKLNDEEDEGFYDDDYLDDEEEVEPVKKFGAAKNSVLHSPRLLRSIVPLPRKCPEPAWKSV